MTSNHTGKTKTVSFEKWLTSKPGLKQGFISVYDNEPFDPDVVSSAYEIGRQIAIVAKTSGFKTKGALIRKKPNSSDYAWVKTKYPELNKFAKSLGFATRELVIR